MIIWMSILFHFNSLVGGHRGCACASKYPFREGGGLWPKWFVLASFLSFAHLLLPVSSAVGLHHGGYTALDYRLGFYLEFSDTAA